MSIVVDMGTWSWFVVAGVLHGNSRWGATDALCEQGSVLCMDSERSLRSEWLPSYKANRAELSPATQHMRRLAREWAKEATKRYSCLVAERGLEADDLVALHASDGDVIISLDKDLLTLPEWTWLVSASLVPWGIEREQRKTKLPLAKGERWLTYQLLHGDVADNIPRLLFSKDRTTAKYVFSQEHPLLAAIDLLPEKRLKQSLACLLLAHAALHRQRPDRGGDSSICRRIGRS
jgi:hypothetical protein